MESARVECDQRGDEKATDLVHLVKYEKLVIVPSTRELTILAPLQPAYFLLVYSELRNPVIFDSNISVVNRSIVRTRRENMFVPSETAD